MGKRWGWLTLAASVWLAATATAQPAAEPNIAAAKREAAAVRAKCGPPCAEVPQ